MQLGHVEGKLFDFDLQYEIDQQRLVCDLIHEGLLASAHDLAEGGLAIALAESAFAGEIGFNVQTDLTAAELFAENQSRFLVTVTPANQALFEAKTAGKAALLGRVGGDRLKILTTDDMLNVDLTAAETSWKEALAWQLN